MHDINPVAWSVIQSTFGLAGFLLISLSALRLRGTRAIQLYWSLPLAILCAFVDCSVRESVSAPGLAPEVRQQNLEQALCLRLFEYVLAYALLYAYGSAREKSVRSPGAR